MASPDILIISRKLVEDHPDKARKLATRCSAAWSYTLDKPEETAKTMAHYFRQAARAGSGGHEVVQILWPKDWKAHTKLHTEQMQSLAQWLYDNKKIPSLPDVAKWENTSFMPNRSDRRFRTPLQPRLRRSGLSREAGEDHTCASRAAC